MNGASFMVAGPAQAQMFDEDNDDPNLKPTDSTVWDAKKLQKLDRNVRKLERAVQRIENKNAPPILIETDPEVVALQATVSAQGRKLEDNSAALVRLTGALEETNFRLAKLDSMVARLEALSRRLDMIEAKVKDIEVAIAPPPPPPASTGSAESDFSQALSLAAQNKTEEAGRAFEAFIQTWPEATQIPEAWFRLGQIRRQNGDTQGSVMAFAMSLKGWPKNAWAPEASIRLSNALLDANRPNDACQALAEFNKRYLGFAAADMKIEAKSLKAKAKCP